MCATEVGHFGTRPMYSGRVIAERLGLNTSFLAPKDLSCLLDTQYTTFTIVYDVPSRIMRVITRYYCACAYNNTAERNLLILLLLRTALAAYWQSLVHLNCACSITIRYYYTWSRKSKWPELVAKYQVQWTRIMKNTRLDSSVRIKTRIRCEVT